MHAGQLKEHIIIPTLQHIGLDSESARELLLGTAAQESHLGHFLKQIRGPACGIYQMEPATHDDIWQNFLRYRPALASKIRELVTHPVADAMISNLDYASAMCRVQYLRDDEPLPRAGDLAGLARTWKRVYNTPLGRGTEAEFVRNYQRLVLNAA